MSRWKELGPGRAEVVLTGGRVMVTEGMFYIEVPCKHEVTDIANIFDRHVYRCECGREVPEADVEQWDRPKGMTPFQVASYLLNEGYAS